jgi:hypothetical protein
VKLLLTPFHQVPGAKSVHVMGEAGALVAWSVRLKEVEIRLNGGSSQ